MNYQYCLEPISVTGLTLNETCLKEGATVALRCNIQGFPRPEIQFRLNDEIITQKEGDFETFTIEFYDQVRSPTSHLQMHASYRGMVIL